MASLHIPVLLNEVLESLVTNEKGVYVDGTFGAGGYTSALLKKHPEAKVIAIDKDPSAIKGGVFIQKLFENRLFLHQDSFANLLSVLEQENLEKVDGIVVDLGVSSMQIDQADRGFS
ncbi:MAG: 16S rRNA (cytosine(1402)-N(4))-methyltransferase, partial [Alphaproteobacteria bacterium]|nr:16S rRNA (cytosine(1402)-N(4))-methyltransferase [Alphaproteobacteria bacterium]